MERCLLFAVTLALLAVSGSGPRTGHRVMAAGPARIWVAPAELSSAGGTVSLQLIQHTDVSTTGAQATLTFDRTRLQVLSIVLGSAYTGATLQFGLDGQPQAQTITEANTTTGIVPDIAAYFDAGASGVPAGDREFLVITFQAIAGGVSPITLSEPEMLDANFGDITPVSVTGGHVGIAYASADADGDGVLDTADNCSAAQNPSQRNDDANFIDQTPPQAIDDKTWINSDAAGNACDIDDDNDGLLDTAEPAGCNGTGPLDPLNRDTDGDLYLDNAECTLGTNPASPTSKPSAASCATHLGGGTTTATDTDGDKVKDHLEFCNYNSNRFSTDSDGDMAIDGARDGCEVASLNNDRIVNVADQGLLAGAISDPTKRVSNFDLNKDGAYNPADQALLASFISPAGQCP